MYGFRQADECGNSKIWRHMSYSSNMKPRLRAEWLVRSEELLVLASCLLRPLSRNSVLEEFSVRRFAVIQDELRSRALWRCVYAGVEVSRKEGRKERAECHLRRGDGLRNKRKWGYLEEWCTWRRVVDQGQSLGGHRRRMCTRNTDQFQIWHGSNEMTDMTSTSWEQSHGYQTRMRDGWWRCHGQ